MAAEEKKSKRKKNGNRNSQLLVEVSEMSPQPVLESNGSFIEGSRAGKPRSKTPSSGGFVESLGKIKRSLAAAMSPPQQQQQQQHTQSPSTEHDTDSSNSPPRSPSPLLHQEHSPDLQSGSSSSRSSSPSPAAVVTTTVTAPASSEASCSQHPADPQQDPSSFIISSVLSSSPSIFLTTPSMSPLIPSQSAPSLSLSRQHDVGPVVPPLGSFAQTGKPGSKTLKELLGVNGLVRQESRLSSSSTSLPSASASALRSPAHPRSPRGGEEYSTPAFALELRSMEDFYRAVGMSHWLSYERQLEEDWDALLNKAFKCINLNSENFRQYSSAGPRAETSRKGIITIQPWCSNRVQLCPLLSSIPDDPDPTFVNASPSVSRFIAAGIPQAPAGREAFWACCFQEKVKQIVMLNQPGEQENQPYWPHTRVSSGFRDAVNEPFRYGHFVVTLVEVIGRNRPEIVHRRFRVDYEPLTPLPSTDQLPFGAKRSTIIEHHHYTDWPDMSVPDNKVKFIKFFEDVLWIRKFHRRPVLVHCFGGAGRTGTFIAIAEMLFGLDLYKKGMLPKTPNLIDVILELRRRRQDQVQTQDQFKFVNRIVYNYVFPQDSHSLQALGLDSEQVEAIDSENDSFND